MDHVQPEGTQIYRCTRALGNLKVPVVFFQVIGGDVFKYNGKYFGAVNDQ